MFLKKIKLFLILICLTHNILTNKTDKFKKDKFDTSKEIVKHISDSHELHICKLTIPLPIILWDNGFKIFLSNKFDNKKLVNKSGIYYILYNNKIYKSNNGLLYFDHYGNPKNKRPIDLSITKNVITIIIISIIILYIFFRMANSYNNYIMYWTVGKYLEPIIIFIRNTIAIPNIGKKKYKDFMPFLLTLFFFILINNLMGILPAIPNITGNISITLGLSFFTFFIIMINSNKYYWKNIFLMPNIPFLIKIILIPIELIEIFIRPLTLSIRLFANIIAGHILIFSLISLIFIFKKIWIAIFSIPFALFISILEVLVAFLQSFIFTNLSALFIGMIFKKNH
ncbi:MAG: F0F1 ATP synthase subunit A [Candidatus Bostrichicola ureolyticus]|nr:MAG: F0F1 ATP synthase subunit A [Candidatus Bostrichicola ureolyticus]